MINRLLCLLPLLVVSSTSASPLFDSHEMLEVKLTGPIGQLAKQKEDKELPFTLRAEGLDHQIDVRLRGKSRRRVCRFPPLRFNFNEEDDRDSVFKGQDKLKLVTHCRNRKDSEVDAIEEYTAYRIFNVINERSFRVRLLKLTYVDTASKKKQKAPESYFGFLIESEAELAQRIEAEKLSIDGVSLGLLEHSQLLDIFVFQYMIGNTDYSLVMTDGEDECCHNGDVFLLQGKMFLVPYDFDLAGLVDARYAYPHPSLRMKSVTQRRYRGFCDTHRNLDQVVKRIKTLEPTIMAIPDTIEVLPEEDRSSMIKYLGGFFAMTEETLLEEFGKDCL